MPTNRSRTSVKGAETPESLMRKTVSDFFNNIGRSLPVIPTCTSSLVATPHKIAMRDESDSSATHDEALRIASMHPAATLGEEGGWVVELIPLDFYLGR